MAGADGRPGRRGGQGVTRQRRDPAATDWPGGRGCPSKLCAAQRRLAMVLAATAQPWPHELRYSRQRGRTRRRCRRREGAQDITGVAAPPEGRGTKWSAAAPSELRERLRQWAATARYVKLAQPTSPAAAARLCPARCRAQPALVVLARSALASTTSARHHASQRRAGCSASRVTPAPSVASAHPSSAAPSGVRCNAASAVGVADAIAVGLALQGG